MTTPYFQIALNRELENDEARRNKAMRVLKVMMSADAQNLVCAGQDTLSYSQDVPLRFTDALSEVRPVVEENHMYCLQRLLCRLSGGRFQNDCGRV